MSNCIEDFYDYDLIKKCSNCGKFLLKSNLHKNNKSKDGLFSQCKFCIIHKQKIYHSENGEKIINRKKDYLKNRDQIIEYRKKYEKNRRDSDLNFKLACILRSRTSMAFKSQNVRKTNKTFGSLGCSHSFFKNWIIHQLYGNMTVKK